MSILCRQHQWQISQYTQVSPSMTSYHIVFLLDQIDKVSIHVLIINAKEYRVLREVRVSGSMDHILLLRKAIAIPKPAQAGRGKESNDVG